MVTQVERGKKQPGPALLAALARALFIPVAELAGQSFLAELQLDVTPSRELLGCIAKGLRIFDYCKQPTEGLMARVTRKDPESNRVAIDHDLCFRQHMVMLRAHEAIAHHPAGAIP